MRFYYKNETLYVDVEMKLDEENRKRFKRRIFRIIDDYDIDHVVVRNYQISLEQKKILQEIKDEYHQKFDGELVIT